MLNGYDITKPETAHRGQIYYSKKHHDNPSNEASKNYLNSFKFSIFINPDDAENSAHQICLQTIVNAASRISLEPNSVQVIGLDHNQRNDNSGLEGTLDNAVIALGGACEKIHSCKETLGIAIGNAEASDCLFLIRAVFDGWRGGIVPYNHKNPFQTQTSEIPLGAILAAGLAVYECFRFRNSDGSIIGSRPIGMSLWDLKEKKWMQHNAEEAKKITNFSSIWFAGLGHLGQAYIWTLGHLPISSELKSGNQITIQDEDTVEISNLSTSLLTNKKNVKTLKVDICNDWLRDRGFGEIVSEPKFLTPRSEIDFGDSHVVCGFDKPSARRCAASKKPKLMIDGGIGGKVDDIQSILMTVLPSEIDPQKRWPDGDDASIAKDASAAMESLFNEGKIDQCGLERLNGTAVGFPFIGVTASAIIIAELLRRNHGGQGISSLSIDLRDVDDREILYNSHD